MINQQTLQTVAYNPYTIYFNASSNGLNPDGSLERPYTTIAQWQDAKANMETSGIINDVHWNLVFFPGTYGVATPDLSHSSLIGLGSPENTIIENDGTNYIGQLGSTQQQNIVIENLQITLALWLRGAGRVTNCILKDNIDLEKAVVSPTFLSDWYFTNCKIDMKTGGVADLGAPAVNITSAHAFFNNCEIDMNSIVGQVITISQSSFLELNSCQVTGTSAGTSTTQALITADDASASLGLRFINTTFGNRLDGGYLSHGSTGNTDVDISTTVSSRNGIHKLCTVFGCSANKDSGGANKKMDFTQTGIGDQDIVIGPNAQIDFVTTGSNVITMA